MNRILDFLASEEGPTAIEYSIVLAFIVVVCITVIGLIGQTTNLSFKNASDIFTP